jgi:hypothetical protein
MLVGPSKIARLSGPISYHLGDLADANPMIFQQTAEFS